MPLFKYLEPIWADRMVSQGSVRVGTLYDFRRIESLGKERGDQDEGVRISRTDGKAHVVEKDEDLPWFARGILRIPPTVSLQLADDAVLEVHEAAPDMFVYCTCSRFDPSLMGLFGGACVEIIDGRSWFGAVTKALDGWTPDGLRCLSGFRLAPCEYAAREQTWPNVTPYDPAFRKPPSYKHQAEVRAAWGTRLLPINPVNLVVPEVRRWSRRIR